MTPIPTPRKPTQFELARNAKKLITRSPSHQSWIDFLYWESELET